MTGFHSYFHSADGQQLLGQTKLELLGQLRSDFDWEPSPTDVWGLGLGHP